MFVRAVMEEVCTGRDTDSSCKSDIAGSLLSVYPARNQPWLTVCFHQVSGALFRTVRVETGTSIPGCNGHWTILWPVAIERNKGLILR